MTSYDLMLRSSWQIAEASHADFLRLESALREFEGAPNTAPVVNMKDRIGQPINTVGALRAKHWEAEGRFLADFSVAARFGPPKEDWLPTPREDVVI